MHVCGQHFSRSVLDRIQETVCEEPMISRLDLSRRVCTWLKWVSPNGQLREMGCRKALGKLHAAGVIDLPKQNEVYSFEHKVITSIEPDIPKIQCTLGELGEVSIYPVSSRYANKSNIWFALLEKHHYLGNGNLCGAQIRYLVKSSHGYLGALAFSSPSWSLKNRDDYLGWTEGARREHLNRVICKSRFLILPTVRVSNLASHVLSLALARVVKDWEQRYHTSPVLVETFVDPAFTGACYQAANFTYVGESAGRRDGVAKKVFLHPLCREWKDILCDEPEIRMLRPEAPRHWAEEEFGTVRLYDERLKERLYTIAQDFYSSPEATIPEACGSNARVVGAYRFFRNPKVNMDVVLTPRAEATIEWIKQYRVVLVQQDTTTLKSGCRIKDRKLETTDRLETCLGLDMVVAWRVYYLTMLGRETPDVPCTVFFKDIEWKALCCYVNKTPIAPDKPPTIRQAVFMVSSMGGHMGRKGDGFPGTQTIWRGLARLYGASEMYAILTHQFYLHPMHSGP